MFELDIDGGFTKAIQKLEAAVSDKLLIAGAAAAAKVFYDEAKINVAQIKPFTGRLQLSIYRAYIPRLSDPGKRATYIVTWRHNQELKGMSPRPDNAPHGWWLEYGHATRGSNRIKVGKKKTEGGFRKGQYWQRELGTSRVPAQPFMRPAYYNNVKRAQQVGIARMRQVLKEELHHVK